MKQKRDLLKSFFETGDYPTQSNFEDLIDSYWHKDDIINPANHFKGDEIKIQQTGESFPSITGIPPSYWFANGTTGYNTSYAAASSFSFHCMMEWHRQKVTPSGNANSEAMMCLAPSSATNHPISIGRTGFYFSTKFATRQTTLGDKLFVGMDNNYNLLGNIEPSNNSWFFGVGYDSTDQNIQIMHNDGTGVATKIDLTDSFLGRDVGNQNNYFLEMWNYRDTQSVYLKLYNIYNKKEHYAVLETDLPPHRFPVSLYPKYWISDKGDGGKELHMSNLTLKTSI